MAKPKPSEPEAVVTEEPATSAPKRPRFRFAVKAKYLPDVEVDVDSEDEDVIRAAALEKWGAKSTDQPVTWTPVGALESKKSEAKTFED